MEMRTIRAVSLVGLAALTLGCQATGSTKDTVGLDRAKMEPLYRSAKAIESSVGVGVNYSKLSELLQNLNLELSIAKDKQLRPDERALVDAYAEAVPVYKDSLALWGLKIEKGRILSSYGQAEELAQKYNIKHEATTTIDADLGMQIIWAKAGEAVAKGNAIYARQQ